MPWRVGETRDRQGIVKDEKEQFEHFYSMRSIRKQ